MKKISKYININHSIRNTDKVFCDKKRFFLI